VAGDPLRKSFNQDLLNRRILTVDRVIRAEVSVETSNAVAKLALLWILIKAEPEQLNSDLVYDATWVVLSEFALPGLKR